MKKRILNILKIFLPLLLGIYLIWYFFDKMDDSSKNHFYFAIQHANYFWIILSLVLGFIAFLSRAYRWKYTLEPLGHTSKFWNRYHAIAIGYIANLTIPRAGEVSRAMILNRSDNVPFDKSFGTIIAERVIDMLMLGGITLFTAYIAYDDFMLFKTKISHQFGMGAQQSGDNSWGGLIKLLFLFLCIVSAIVLYKKAALRNKIFSFARNIFDGTVAVFKSKHPFLFLFHTIIIWGCYVGMAMLPFYALDQTANIPLKGVLLTMVASSVGVILTNGGIGVVPLLAGIVVASYLEKDFPASDAMGYGNALGMIAWASQTLLIIIVGLISLILVPKKYVENETNELHSVKDSSN